MAQVSIIENNAPYYCIEVEFGGQVFQQTIVTSKTGAELDSMLKQYADGYESAWNNLDEANTAV